MSLDPGNWLSVGVAVVAILGGVWAGLKFFGGPLLAQSIRTALAPELARLGAIERDLQQLRDDHDLMQAAMDTKAERIGDLDRRVTHNASQLAVLPTIQTSLNYLTAEIGRANGLSERANAEVQKLAVQVGSLRGAFDERRLREA